MGAATRRASLRSLILVVMRRVGCGRGAPQLGRIDEAVRGGEEEERMGYGWF